MTKRKLLLLLPFCWTQLLNAQHNFPQDYFRSPLDIPLFLAGNFAEIRSNHFHGGIDLKTESVEGKNIYAVADGYISRIKVSSYGYGKVLYLTHPNGYTTVYAHLQKYSKDIETFVQQAQYKEESFEIELYPDSTQLQVKKGDIIAISGNTGGSGGPHLHFEIRDTKSEDPLNPLLFGFDVKDNIPPLIKDIGVYPMNDSSFVNNKNVSIILPSTGTNGHYKLKNQKAIEVHGDIGFGIETIDYLNGSGNKNGIYSIELLVNNQRMYYHEMERYKFQDTRYLNSLIDYYKKMKTGKVIQRSFLQPNNQLTIYKGVINHGIITFDNDTTYTISYIVKDTHGNVSQLDFQVLSKLTFPLTKINNEKISSHFTDYFKYDEHNKFSNDTVSVSIPPGILYENIDFEYSVSDTIKGAITPTYHIHNPYVPLHSFMTLTVKVENIKKEMENKALIVYIDKDGRIKAEGGTLSNQQITINSKTLGSFSVMIDTIPPKIVPISVKSNYLAFRISDNLSGIKSYKGYIDGKWILMEYDFKTERLFANDANYSKLQKGKHSFELIVTDEKNNQKEYKSTFVK